MNVKQKLLKPGHKPGCFGGIGAQARIGGITQGRIQKYRQQHEQRHQAKARGCFPYQQVRPYRQPRRRGFRCFSRGTGNDQPVSLANPPEMIGQKDKQQHRHNRRVKRVKQLQRGLADFVAAAQRLLQPLPDNGYIAQHGSPDGRSPVGQLIPGQQIAAEICRQHTDQQAQADNPGGPPRGTIGAGKKHP